MKKLRVGILGATGMVGQQFAVLLANHPWFEVTVLAASSRSSGKTYQQSVTNRWSMEQPIPPDFADKIVYDAQADIQSIIYNVDLVFCALDMDKAAIKQLEIDYAANGVAVISNNSAHRWTKDVPIIMPEINPHHADLINIQRKNRGWDKGLIAVKPNCSIQSYVSILTALMEFGPTDIAVTSLQAISGAGKTFESWPEMIDNIIPLIAGEEDKSELEPLKIWGKLTKTSIKTSTSFKISATCIRVPVTNGHMASVSVSFKLNPTYKQIINAINKYNNLVASLNLPSKPLQFIKYYDEDDRPQTKLDRNIEHGMGITMGRLRKDTLFDWKFISLSHNTIRGAAGGAILMAELLVQKGYIR